MLRKKKIVMLESDINAITNTVITLAKQELLPRYSKVCRQHKKDGSIVTEADVVMQEKIQQYLQQQFPESIILGEEMSAEEQNKTFDTGQAIWCLDPLDGTSNFAFGIPYFAVSLALIENGQVNFALVYDPIRDECFTSSNKQAYLNNNTITLQISHLELNRATAIIDFKRLQKDLAISLVADSPFSSQRNFGASALDWCWLALERGHVYLHGSQNIWDYAAGQSIFEYCGGISQTLDGDSIFKNQLVKRSVVAAIDMPLFLQWKNWIEQHSEL